MNVYKVVSRSVAGPVVGYYTAEDIVTAAQQAEEHNAQTTVTSIELLGRVNQ